MSYDEITTKIEIPTPKTDSNIVHIDFTNTERKRELRQKNSAQAQASAPRQTHPAFEPGKVSLIDRIGELDLQSPWVIRLVAVVLVLALSMLVL